MTKLAPACLSMFCLCAFGAQVYKADFNTLDLDSSPKVVTNVTFEGLATEQNISDAIEAAIATNNPAFVNAVTNCPVSLSLTTDQSLAGWGAYGTLGALLAALMAGVFNLNRDKADKTELSYQFVTPSPSALGDITLVDRAVNVVSPTVMPITAWEWSDGVDRGAPIYDDYGSWRVPDGNGDIDYSWEPGYGEPSGQDATYVSFYKMYSEPGPTVEFVSVTPMGDGSYDWVIKIDGASRTINDYSSELWYFWDEASGNGYYLDSSFSVSSEEGDTSGTYMDGSIDISATLTTIYESNVSSLTLPARSPGRSRDFLMKLVIPENFSFAWPSGASYVTSDGSMPDVSTAGTYYVSFTELADGIFGIASKQLKAVSS